MRAIQSLASAALLVLTNLALADTVVVGPQADPYKPGYDIEVVSQDSWTGAEAYAQSLAPGANLMSISSYSEDLWICNEILRNYSSTGGPSLGAVPVWIGFDDPSQDANGGSHASNFVWADGSSSTFTDWNSGEPNDTNSDEFYTALDWQFAQDFAIDPDLLGTWNDAPDAGTSGGGGYSDGPYYGLIEIPAADVTPLPNSALAGMVLFGLLLGGAVARGRFELNNGH